MSKFFKSILLLIIVLFVFYMLVFFPIMHRENRFANKNFVTNRSLSLFIELYNNSINRINGGEIIPIDVFEKSYYYPYESGTPISVTKDEVIINNIYFKDDKIYVTFVVKKYDGNDSVIKDKEFHYNQKTLSEIERNIKWLKHLSLSVNEKKDFVEKCSYNYKQSYEFLLSTYIARKGEKNAIKKPVEKGILLPCNIKGMLPTNKELNIFLDWVAKIEGYDSKNEIADLYGTPIKFKVISEGLKATSAGSDKEFDTDDDITFIRTYESVGMKQLN